MRRLFRIFLNILTPISLLLCIASLALWVRSGTTEDLVSWHDTHRSVMLSSGDRYFSLQLNDSIPLNSERGSGWVHSHGPVRGWTLEGGLNFLEAIGFNVYRIPPQIGISTNRLPEGRYFAIFIPLLLIAAVTAMLPTIRFFCYLHRRKRKRSQGAGLCASCGYDLRATPDRCPECGAAATAIRTTDTGKAVAVTHPTDGVSAT